MKAIGGMIILTKMKVYQTHHRKEDFMEIMALILVSYIVVCSSSKGDTTLFLVFEV